MWKNLEYNKWRILFKEDESKMTPFNHNHLDYYSFILMHDNKIILTDSGGSSYDLKLKDIDARLPEYHNSIRVKSLGYKPDNSKYFTKKYIDCVFRTTIKKHQESLEISLMSTGFNRIDEAINFTRIITIEEFTTTIEDKSFSEKSYPIEHYFHFPIKSKISNLKNYSNISIDKKMIRMTYDESHQDIEVNKNKFLRYYSEQYNCRDLKSYIKINSFISTIKPVIYKFEVIE